VLFLVYEREDMGAVFTEPVMLQAVVSSGRIVVGPKSEELPAPQLVEGSRTRRVGTFWMELLKERSSRGPFAAG
jgi:hypothetical protein